MFVANCGACNSDKTHHKIRDFFLAVHKPKEKHQALQLKTCSLKLRFRGKMNIYRSLPEKVLPAFLGDSNRGSFSVRQSGRSRTSQKLCATRNDQVSISDILKCLIGVRLFSQLHSKLIKVKLISGSMKNIHLHWGSTFRGQGVQIR